MYQRFDCLYSRLFWDRTILVILRTPLHGGVYHYQARCRQSGNCPRIFRDVVQMIFMRFKGRPPASAEAESLKNQSARYTEFCVQRIMSGYGDNGYTVLELPILINAWIESTCEYI
ncbi:hypothetical protein BKA67DRAFT_537080 [Truncatella angustata]|uniref:Uncharacterized protein n=1 Tax=Truncatella angustata TaxID=152316 RepID=A0A9P8UJJ1_9PEZI|nr:uncharacterized protein BKA67DRAFT_537080 [Truncatella angustata]KAH6653395.1 hypothetical protein BKA67DRAFT_537080 [Truncatella angustata]